MNGNPFTEHAGVWRPVTGIALICLLGIIGCGGSPSPPVQTEYLPFTPDQMHALESAKDAEYRLRPGDRLAVDFKYEDDLDSTKLLVLPDGRLTLPGGVDPVIARGRTVTQLDSTLTALYARDYLNPELSVIIEDIADLPVYVFGFVRRPGEITLERGGMGVLQAIATAGGFDDDAEPTETAIMRVTPDGMMLRRLDFSHLQRRGIPDVAALDLQPYDIIYVPRSTLGDISYISDTLLETTLNVTRLFWDIYAINEIDKVTTLYR